jgi:hypothetical protein
VKQITYTGSAMTPLRALLAAVALASSLYGQTTHYVRADGSDANDGTRRDRAWQTLAHELHAGDTLLLRGGDTFHGTLRITASGVTVATYGKGRATIDSGDADAIDVTSAGNIHITNLNLRSTSLANKILERSGIAIANGGPKQTSITIDHVDVAGYTLAGIVIRSGDRVSGYDGITMDTVSVHDIGYVGIALYGDERGTFSNLAIRHALVQNVTGYVNAYGVVVQGSGSGISINGLTTGTLANNVILGNGGLFGGGANAVDLVNVVDVTIEENEVGSTTSGNASGPAGIGVATSESVRIRYNYTHEDEGGGIRLGAVQNALVAYNILENDTLALQSVDSASVFHNTIFAGPRTALSIDGGSGLLLANNLVLTAGGTLLDGSGSATFLNNDLYDVNHQPHINWNGGPATDPSTISADPMLPNAGANGGLYPKALSDLTAYRFAPNSPVVDAGFDLTTRGINPGLRDFYGGFNLIGLRPDIGAYEYGALPYPPSLEPIAAQTVPAGDAIDVDVWIHDPDGASGVSVSLVNAPPWATIRRVSASHAIVTLAPILPGGATITVRATDESAQHVDVSFSVTATGTLPRQRAVRR